MSSCSSNQFSQQKRTKRKELAKEFILHKCLTMTMLTTFFSIWTRIYALHSAIQWLWLIVIYRQIFFSLFSSSSSATTIALPSSFQHISVSYAYRATVNWNIFAGIEKNFFAMPKTHLSNMYVSAVFAWLHIEQPSHIGNVHLLQIHISLRNQKGFWICVHKLYA